MVTTRIIQLQTLDVLGVTDQFHNESLVSRVVSGLADEIGMKRVGRVRKAVNNCTLYIQLIKESHIAAHSHYDGSVLVSIVSCKRFDKRRAIEYIKERLDLRNIRVSGGYG